MLSVTYMKKRSTDLSHLQTFQARVSENPPFTQVGLDFAGPLFVDNQNITEGANKLSKVYVPIHLCVNVSSSLRIDPRSPHSSIPIRLQMICESTTATSHAEFRQH